MSAVLVPAAAAARSPLHVVDAITLARVPAWPVERALRLQAAADWRAEVRQLFAADPEFRTAVLLATSGLRFAERDGALDERAAVKLLAYASRMATRTTPFGLFASVGPAAFDLGPTTVAPMRERRARANLGFDALVAAYDALLGRRTNGRRCRHRAGAGERDSARRRPLRALRRAQDGRERGRAAIPQRLDPHQRADRLRARARGPAGRRGRAVRARWPSASASGAERARSLVDRLADARFLVPASHPLPTDDALARLRASAARRAAAGAAGRRRGARGARRRRRAARPGGGRRARRRRSTRWRPRRSSTRSSTMRPTGRCSCRRGCAPTSCGWPTRVLRCGHREHIDTYRERFMERYESGERWIPLLDLVAPTGIGIPGENGPSRPSESPSTRTGRAASPNRRGAPGWPS